MRILKLHLSFILTFIIITADLYPQQINSEREKTIQSLIKQFSDKDRFISGKAIDTLVKIGKPVVDYLTKSLEDENSDVRECSAIALGKIIPLQMDVIPALIKALKDKNANVRWYSVVALGNSKSNAKPAVQELLKLLNDDDKDVRWAAYTSLTKIDKSAITQVPGNPEVIKKLDNDTPLLMKELKVPGVSICIIKNNKLVWSKGYGVADVSKQIKVNDKTIFEACSMSKPVFAYLVLKLAEEGKIDLDKPLYKYKQEVFVCDNEEYSKLITARMILTHTSGLPNWRKGDEERGGPLPVYFKPGTKFSYSGEGFYYLQRVVEHIINEPLEVFAKRKLFVPLELESTSFVWPSRLDTEISTGHDTSGNCLKRSKYTHANSAFTLYTTPNDYAKFIIEIMKPVESADYSLSKKMIAEMVKHQLRVDTREVVDRPGRSLGLFSYRGLGWGIDSTITGNIVFHSGANQTGFRCYSQFNIKEGSGIVIMTNSINGSDLWSKLISAVGDL